MKEYIVEFKMTDESTHKIKIKEKSKVAAFIKVEDSLVGNTKVNLKDLEGNLIMIQTNYLISFKVIGD